MGRKPSNYVEWRALYQRSLSSLGFAYATLFGARRLKLDWLVQRCARSVYEKARRVERIHANMEICVASGDTTFFEAALESGMFDPD